MKVRAYWRTEVATVQEIDIPADVTLDELDEYIWDNLEYPEVELADWEEVDS